jgi:hypothetical protein
MGQAITNAVSLTVNNLPPFVTTQPSNHTVAVNGTATFTATANGNPAPAMQWQVSTDGGKTFTNVAGGTANTLIVTAPGVPGIQLYRAVFTSPLGSVTSKTVTLAVDESPRIRSEPSDMAGYNVGQTAVFTVGAFGTPAPRVQWQVSRDNGATWTSQAGATSTYTNPASTTDPNLKGVTWTTLRIPVQNSVNDNLYRVVFTNSLGQAISDPVRLVVNNAPPLVVVTQPRNQTAAVNGSATFTAAALLDGFPAPNAVQWQVSTDHGKTFAPIAGATSTTLTLPSVTLADNGNQYRAVFISLPSVTSKAATLTVDVPPAITTQPVPEAVRAGQMVTFTAAASGTTPKVQWQVSTNGGKTFTNLAGATSATLSFTATARQNGYRYRAVFSNAVGQATSDSVALVIW